MKYALLLFAILACLFLSAERIPPVYQLESIEDANYTSGPGHSGYFSGDLYLYNYSGNLLSNIEKYTANYYTPPDKISNDPPPILDSAGNLGFRQPVLGV